MFCFWLADFVFYTFMEKCHCVSYGRMLGRAKTELLPVKWMIKGITSDCGVFAMRHMETYMGNKANEWKCDLTSKPSKSFQLLRAKFCQALVYSNENTAHSNIMRTATSHFEQARNKGHIDVEKMVWEYPKPS